VKTVETMRLRPFTKADTPRVVDVLNAASLRETGHLRAVVDGTGAVRKTRWVAPGADRVVADVGGEIVGYAYLVVSPPFVVCEMGGAVDPDRWEQGIGTALVRWAEGRADEIAACAPAGSRVVLQATVFDSELRARRLLEREGYHTVREWVHRAVELDAPRVPEVNGVTIRPMNLEDDWDAVGPAMDEAFADHWGALIEPVDVPDCIALAPTGDSEQDGSYSNTPGLCFVALSDGDVAGCVLCNGKLIGFEGVGRVGSLSVRPRYRRRGIGRMLMLAAFDAFWRRGVRRIVTDTDAASLTDSNRLYASLGMQVYRRELTYEKEVRPGRELRRLT
jgi:GNAT superfamily N-acetyltransferase